MAQLTLTIDGKARAIEVDDPEMPVLYALRVDLQLNSGLHECAEARQCRLHLVRTDRQAGENKSAGFIA